MMRFLLAALLAFALAPLHADAAPEKHLDIRRLPQISAEDTVATPLERSIVNESRVPGYGARASALPPPPPSPGILVGYTSYDLQHQHSQSHQIGHNPSDTIVHFCWTMWDIIPLVPDENSILVAYSTYTKVGNGGHLNQPFGGGCLECENYGAFCNLSYTESNTAQLFVQMQGSSWHYDYPFPGSAGFNPPYELGGDPSCPNALYPHGEAARDVGSSGAPLHVVAHDDNMCDRDLIWYWRFDGVNWIGPSIIDSNFSLGYVVCDDPNSNKVAIVLHTDREPQFNTLNNVAYYQSTTGGLGWLSGAETGDVNKVLLTNYADAAGPQAWLHISAAYDNAGVLHIVWDEQRVANVTEHVAIRHWNSVRNTIRPVALGYWDSPLSSGAFNLNLAKITMGIGDGATFCQQGAPSQSNLDYVYVSYTQYAGPSAVEQEDASVLGLYNGEQYLIVSNSGGNTWSLPVNLTNTKTPNCNPGPGAPGAGGQPPRPDSVCRSEAWGTISKNIRDIDILFISDLDAGAIAQGEGTWQMNRVHYLRIPGGPANPNALHVCPKFAPNFEAILTADPDCEYHAGQSEAHIEALTILNLGNEVLNGSAVVTTDFAGVATLELQNPGVFTINAGDADIIQTVTMSANGASEGMYQGVISITHSDTSEPNPRVYPIDFFVFNQYYCVCDCPCLNDPECDGVISNVLDVMCVIDVAFRGMPPVVDVECPRERTDVDCTGDTDVIDVMHLIDVAFRGDDAAAEYCEPCPWVP